LLRAVVDWWPPIHTTNFIIFIFAPKSDGTNDATASSPIVIALHVILPKGYPIVLANFWLVVASPHPAEAIKIQGPVALSIFNFPDAQFAAQNNE
jgi:hypothetical protein